MKSIRSYLAAVGCGTVFIFLSPAYADYKLPYPAGQAYQVSQGNHADTNGDQFPDRDGDHGCFNGVNIGSCDSKSTFAFDFAMPGGHAVVASAAGTVRFVQDQFAPRPPNQRCSKSASAFTNYMVIAHPDGTETAYLHLQQSSIVVSVNQAVSQGQSIAKSGNTGWVCGVHGGYHLHFQRQSPGETWSSKSVPLTFADVLTNGGILVATAFYTSGNPFAITAPPSSARVGPPIPYEDFGGCPGEGCVYGEWVASKETVTRHDRSRSSPIAFRLKQGERIVGVTGVLTTVKPGQAKLFRPIKIGDTQAKAGDVVFILNYKGESTWKVWFQGRMIDDVVIWDQGRIEGRLEKISEITNPEYIWWIKIRNSKGEEGWSNEPDNFCRPNESAGRDCGILP